MAQYYTHIKQVEIVLYIQTKLPWRQILTDTNTDVRSVHEHISRQTHLCVMKIKRHLLRWHLLQSHAPPPLLHPSCHNCKNSTNTRTHTHSHIHTHPHTPFFLLTPFPAHHGSLQLVLVCPLSAAACVQCVCVCPCVPIRVSLSSIAVVPAELRHVLPTSGTAAWGRRKWTVSHVLFWPPLSCEKLQPPKTQSVLHLRAGRGLKCQWQIQARLAVALCLTSAFYGFSLCASTRARPVNVTIGVWNQFCA